MEQLCSAARQNWGGLDTELLLMPTFSVDCAPRGAELLPWALSLATPHCPTLTDPSAPSGHFFPLTGRQSHSSPEQHDVRKPIPFPPQPAGKGREKGQGGQGRAQGPAQAPRVTFMTGWAKYLALQSQNPVCTAAEMKLLCPTASSASSAVCGEGTGLTHLQDTPRDTPTAPARQEKPQTHCPGQETPCTRLWDPVLQSLLERCTFPQPQGSGLEQPQGTPGRSQEEFCHSLPRMWHGEQRG